jgi:hypothetical protein
VGPEAAPGRNPAPLRPRSSLRGPAAKFVNPIRSRIIGCMVEKQGSSRTVGFSRAAAGERLGGFIYGTILVLAVLVAGARAYPHASGHIAALVAVTSAVF